MNDAEPMAKRLLTFKQAAAYVKISESAFRKIIYRGVGPPSNRRHGRQYRFLPEELDAWLEKGWKGPKNVDIANLGY